MWMLFSCSSALRHFNSQGRLKTLGEERGNRPPLQPQERPARGHLHSRPWENTSLSSEAAPSCCFVTAARTSCFLPVSVTRPAGTGPPGSHWPPPGTLPPPSPSGPSAAHALSSFTSLAHPGRRAPARPQAAETSPRRPTAAGHTHICLSRCWASP